MIRSFFLALATAGALFAVPAKAQALTDGEVVAVYAQVNSFDIEAALLGASRGKAPSVRALAAMVAGDHLGVRRAVNALARDAGITLSLPADRAAAAAEHDARMAKLITLSGGDFDRVVRITVYLVDLGNFARLNEIMATYFREPYPARVAIGVAVFSGMIGVTIVGLMLTPTFYVLSRRLSGFLPGGAKRLAEHRTHMTPAE